MWYLITVKANSCIEKTSFIHVKHIPFCKSQLLDNVLDSMLLLLDGLCGCRSSLSMVLYPLQSHSRFVFGKPTFTQVESLVLRYTMHVCKWSPFLMDYITSKQEPIFASHHNPGIQHLCDLWMMCCTCMFGWWSHAVVQLKLCSPHWFALEPGQYKGLLELEGGIHVVEVLGSEYLLSPICIVPVNDLCPLSVGHIFFWLRAHHLFLLAIYHCWSLLGLRDFGISVCNPPLSLPHTLTFPFSPILTISPTCKLHQLIKNDLVACA